MRAIDAKLARHDPVAWIQYHGLVNERGEPFEFEKHRFLVDFLQDWSKRIVVRKSAQVGFSSAAILKSFFAADIGGLTIIHTLPTDTDSRTFVTTKVNPIVDKNPYLQEILDRQVDSTERKKVRDGFVLYQGTIGQSRGIMVSSDINMHDELDRSDAQTVETYRSRLDGSAYGYRWEFSNPSRPGAGVDVAWRMSDQKQWYVTCEACGLEQPLDWWQNVDRERRVFCCRACREDLTDEVRMRGRWVAENPEARISGYQVSQLITTWHSADELLDVEEEVAPAYFYNFELGLPKADSAIAVSTETVLGARQDPPAPKGVIRVAGVDVGTVLHAVWGTEHGIHGGQVLKDFEELHQFIRAKNLDLLVIDNNPETHKVGELQAKREFRGKVLRCIYDYNERRPEMFEVDKDRGLIQAHRTRVIDHTIATMAAGIHIYLGAHDPVLYQEVRPGRVPNALANQWATMYVIAMEQEEDGGGNTTQKKKVKVDRGGNVVRIWDHDGPDHFAHAHVYYEIARQIKLPFVRASKQQRPADPYEPRDPQTGV